MLVGRRIALAQAALRMELDGRAVDPRLGRARAPEDGDEGLTQIAAGRAGRLRCRRRRNRLLQAGRRRLRPAAFYARRRADGNKRRCGRGRTLALKLFPPLAVGHPTAPPRPRACCCCSTRAGRSATSGILPTAALALAPGQVNGALSTLDLAFFAAPCRGEDRLRHAAGAAGSRLPELVGRAGARRRRQRSGVGGDARDRAAGQQAVWSTPQTVTEGWLRLGDPARLRAARRRGQAGRDGGRRQRDAADRQPPPPRCVRPRRAGARGNTPNGSIFYLHLGGWSPRPRRRPRAAGWQFARFDDPAAGPTRTAATTTPTTLAADDDRHRGRRPDRPGGPRQRPRAVRLLRRRRLERRRLRETRSPSTGPWHTPADDRPTRPSQAGEDRHAGFRDRPQLASATDPQLAFDVGNADAPPTIFIDRSGRQQTDAVGADDSST